MNSLKAAAPSIFVLRTRSQRIVRRASTQHHVPLSQLKRQFHASNEHDLPSGASKGSKNEAYAGRPWSIWQVPSDICLVGVGCSVLILVLGYGGITSHAEPKQAVPKQDQKQSPNSSNRQGGPLSIMRANLIIHLRSSPKGEEYVRALLDDYDSICSKYDKRLEARAQEMNLELLKCAQQNITDEESASSAGLITETGLRDIHKIVEEILHDTLHARPVLEAKAGDWRTWFWHHAEEMIRSPRQEVEQNWGQIREHLLGGKEFNLWPLPDLDQEYP